MAKIKGIRCDVFDFLYKVERWRRIKILKGKKKEEKA